MSANTTKSTSNDEVELRNELAEATKMYIWHLPSDNSLCSGKGDMGAANAYAKHANSLLEQIKALKARR